MSFSLPRHLPENSKCCELMSPPAAAGTINAAAAMRTKINVFISVILPWLVRPIHQGCAVRYSILAARQSMPRTSVGIGVQTLPRRHLAVEEPRRQEVVDLFHVDHGAERRDADLRPGDLREDCVRVPTPW